MIRARNERSSGLRADSQFFYSTYQAGVHAAGPVIKIFRGNHMVSQAVYLTPDGLIKLEEELEHLRTVKRQEVARRLHEAMEDGELIENAEYEAAKNEQAFVEGRILELENILAKAKIIERGKSRDIVSIGSTVVVQEPGSAKETYTIVGVAEANPREGMISNESPLGRALLDKKAGEQIEVNAPAGTLRFKIVEIK
jgi:transcription elongation factor GreA